MATLVKQRKYNKKKKSQIKKQRQKTKLIYPTIDVSIKCIRVFVLVAIF
jgi:hypothetical protein